MNEIVTKVIISQGYASVFTMKCANKYTSVKLNGIQYIQMHLLMYIVRSLFTISDVSIQSLVRTIIHVIYQTPVNI